MYEVNSQYDGETYIYIYIQNLTKTKTAIDNVMINLFLSKILFNTSRGVIFNTS